MNINFLGKDDVRSKALEELCEKKLIKVANKLDTDNVNADVNFSLENRDFVMSIQLFVNGEKYVAKSKGNDMYKNVDDCIDKLNSQLRKVKENKKGAKKPNINID